MNPPISTNDLLNYLNHLKDIKKSLGDDYYFHKEDDLYIIFDKNSIPKLTLSQEIFRIFRELEV